MQYSRFGFSWSNFVYMTTESSFIFYISIFCQTLIYTDSHFNSTPQITNQPTFFAGWTSPSRPRTRNTRARPRPVSCHPRTSKRPKVSNPVPQDRFASALPYRKTGNAWWYFWKPLLRDSVDKLCR